MYLKKLKINNFRKFTTKNNLIEFVNSSEGLQQETINVASATTLIVGKNNSGKTTITNVLDKLIKNRHFSANDYNFSYLFELLKEYKDDRIENFPTLEFEILIGLGHDDGNNDLITNIVPFINIENTESNEFKIKIRYEIIETVEFKDCVKKLIQDYSDPNIRFKKYLELIEDVEKKTSYYNSEDEIIEKGQFKLSDLIDIKIIAANKIINDTSLSEIFNKIIQYKYKTENMDNINVQIDKINEQMTEKISQSHSGYINGALHAIENKEKLEIRLSSDLDFDKLIKQLLKYQYVEQGLNIPEGQFGLGYSNLMSIIGHIIDYIEQYPDEEFHSRLNLICIEEPEAFMHPQMQELFIQNINDAVTFLLDGSTKKINSQLVVTTHSSHILNSKIQTCNSFNNINYMTITENASDVISLHDGNVLAPSDYSDSSELNNSLKFIKKHIKYKVSELFFSDAVILVEGITEEAILSHFIHNDQDLSKYYISIFNINGAHGLVYHNLIRLLKVPAVIVTDLDIYRSDDEKDSFLQITSLDNRTTTNNTIIKYNGSNNIAQISDFFKVENIYVAFQSKLLEGYYATSFEESLILSNYNNSILNNTLEKIKPRIYKRIIGESQEKEKLKNSSYELQAKLSKSKSDFSNELLFQLITKNEGVEGISIPSYIVNSLQWLKSQLKPKDDDQEV